MKNVVKVFCPVFGIRAKPFSNSGSGKKVVSWRILNAKVLYYQDQKGEVNPGWELAKWCLGLSSHTLPAIALGMLKIKPVLRFYFGLLRLRAFEIPPAPLPIFCSKALLIVYKSQLRLHS